MLKNDSKIDYSTKIQQLEAENQRLVSELISLKYKELQRQALEENSVRNRPSAIDIESFFKLQRSNTGKVKTVFNNYPFPVFEFVKKDANFILKDCNKKALEITHNKIISVLGSDISKIWHESPELIYLLNTCYKDKSIKFFQGKYTFRSSQESFFVQATYGYIKDHVIHVLIEDITENHISDELLKNSEKLFELFINSSPDIYCIKDNLGRWQVANDEILKIFNLKRKTFKGKTNIQLARNNERYRPALSFCEETDEFAWKRKKISHLIERIPDGNDKTIYYDIYKIPVFNDDGTRKMLIVQGRNVTERIKSEEKQRILQEKATLNELKLKRLINALPDIMFTVRKDGLILNTQNGDIFNNKLTSEPLAANIKDIFPEDLTNKLLESIKQIIDCEIVEPFQCKLSAQNKSHRFEIRLVKHDDISAILILRDQTDLMIKNEELTLAKTKAEESDKLKTAFIANLSHEIRTPLNGIVGFSEIIALKNITPEKRKHFSTIITQSSKQLLGILNDLLDISKFDAGQVIINPGHFRLNTVMDEIFQIYNNQCNKDVKLTYSKELSIEDSSILSDKHRVIQLLSILLSNAVKYTLKGSINFGYTIKNGSINLYCIDSGIGIAPQYHDKIFERFFQEPSDRIKLNAGTGVGLSLAKKITELMNGKIHLVSTPHAGSSFFIKLPYEKSENTN